MFHPGGFGDFGRGYPDSRRKEEPSLFKPILFLVSLLLLWVVCFACGLWLGFGWYAWPLGSFVLLGGFIAFSTFRAYRRSVRANHS